MTAKRITRMFVLLVALTVFAVTTGEAAAQCCGTPSYSVAYRAYSPVAYTAYRPVAYTTYRPVSAWYPGYWWDSFWGTNYSASYAAYYPSTYVASYPTTAYYAPSSCTTCYAPSCSTCYAPACSGCAVGCASCSPCVGNCSPSAGCATCGVTRAAAPSSTYSGGSAPSLAPSENPPTQRGVQKPTTDVNDVKPEPVSDGDENASIFEAPLLFNPKDQTAAKSADAPVHTAVYNKPVASQRPTVRHISLSRADAQQDAAGWSSIVD